MISDEVWRNVNEQCSSRQFEGNGCDDSFDAGDIDTYNIYAPVCIESPDGSLHSSSYVRTAAQDTCALSLLLEKKNYSALANQRWWC